MCTRAPPRVRPEIRAISRNRSAVDETACGVKSRRATSGHGFFGGNRDVAVGHHDSDIQPQKLSVKRNSLKMHGMVHIFALFCQIITRYAMLFVEYAHIA
jgi:hypothetical protein